MTDTTAASGLVKQNFDAQFYIDFIRQSRFAPYMGTDQTSLIVLREDLTKMNGDSITLALVNALTGNGVTGSSTLEGNEEAMDSRSMRIIVNQFRNAVRVPMLQEQFSAIDLMKAARQVLLNWRLSKHKTDIVNALGSINGTVYASASEANKDAWLVDNVDRTAFGDVLGTGLSDHSAALGAIASTEKLTAANQGKLKRAAQTCDPIISPIRIDGTDREFYVHFVDARIMRDMKADSTIAQANREARPRSVEENPIFQGGALLYDGVITVEIPEIASLGAVGTCSAKVSPSYLCGQAALTYAVAKRPELKVEVFDYADKNGVAVREVSKVAKNIFGTGSGDTDDLKDHGVATGYYAAAADA